MKTPNGSLLGDIADRARRHEDELDRDVRFYTVGDLAARWHCGKSTVRAIAFDELPWKNLGRGIKREMRRYHPSDVAAYEARMALPNGRSH